MSVFGYIVLKEGYNNIMINSNDIQRYILSLVEEQRTPGIKLPGARQIADTLGCSLLYVQGVLRTLTQCGVLESLPRSGTYIRPDWEQRVLMNNLVIYHEELPHFKAFKEHFEKAFPDFYCSDRFKNGSIELKVTHDVLAHRDDYADLSELFNQCFPEKSLFFQEPLRDFYCAGKLVGIPLVFSPGVICCNRELFKQAGVELPSPDWDFETFYATVCRLRKALPETCGVINLKAIANWWFYCITASGGEILDREAEDPVAFDSPAAIRGLCALRKLKEALLSEAGRFLNDRVCFAQNRLAMFMGFRQSVFHFKDMDTCLLPLPTMGGPRTNFMGGDLLVFRKECTDTLLMKRVIKFMLSPEIQVLFGKTYGGIPLLKKAAEACLDEKEDRVYLDALPHMRCDYHFYGLEPMLFLRKGMDRLLSFPAERIPEAAKEFAAAFRTYLEIYFFHNNWRKRS